MQIQSRYETPLETAGHVEFVKDVLKQIATLGALALFLGMIGVWAIVLH